MALTEQRKESMYKYAKENLKRIPLDVQKEKYEEIKEAAATSGEKINSYIKSAIESKMSEVIIHLKHGINTNIEVQNELENALLENSEALAGYSRESWSNGTARFVLKFKSKSHISEKVIKTFTDILEKYNVL